VAGVAVCWLGCLLLAAGPLADAHGAHWWGAAPARAGAAGATLLAVVLLAWRIGGPLLLVAGFAAVCAVALLMEPRGWVLSAGAVVAATSYGLLGMVMTRPVAGVRALREAAVVAVIGAAGAVVVTGYAVPLRPYRFRMMALALTLLAALLLARRLGLGFEGLGRRGMVLVVVPVLVLVLALGYLQAVRQWGSSGIPGSVSDVHDRIRGWLGVSPRLIEALVGFPATVLGVTVRRRERTGWWISAFGALAAAGIAASLVPATLSLIDAAKATGYDLVIGSILGLALTGVARMFGGARRRSALPVGVDVHRVEPSRLGHLL
jgi:hypothetical protein